MREVKRARPSATVALRYDKVWVGDKCFVWCAEEGRVVEAGRDGVVREVGPAGPGEEELEQEETIRRLQSELEERDEEMVTLRETVRQLQNKFDGSEEMN